MNIATPQSDAATMGEPLHERWEDLLPVKGGGFGTPIAHVSPTAGGFGAADVADPEKNSVVIMKDGKIYKNIVK